MKEISVTEQLLMTTVRIECSYSFGGIGIGTGFFLNLFTEENGNVFPILVTNKHVIKGAISGRLILPFKLGSMGPELKGMYLLTIVDFEKPWIGHPDKNVDLCAMPFANPYQMMLDENKLPYIKWLDTKMIPTQEECSQLTPIEEIKMIGYPIGLWDVSNNLPVVRSGITATSAAVDYNGKKEFVIDAACFPGSSGSPVLLHNPGGYWNGSTFVVGERTKLLGVLYAGPIHTINGEIKVVQIPTSSNMYSNVGIPINLGYVIKSSRILEFEPIFREQLRRNRLPKVNVDEIKSE